MKNAEKIIRQDGYVPKIAVTGSTGFIGQHVIAELAKMPVELIAITRQSEPKLPHFPNGKMLQYDIESLGADPFVQLGQPDILIHLAWGGLPNYKSLHHFENELPMHYQFLQKLVKSGLKHLFVAGTCFEYGMQSGPLSENIETFPNNPYGFAKDTLRRQLEYLREEHPFTLTWGRLFYLHGSGQAKRSILPLLQESVRCGNDVFNMSGGEQLRDYLPVSEVAKRIVFLALLKKDVGVINVSSGQAISIRKLVENKIEENNWSIKLNLGYYPYPDYEPMAFWGNSAKYDNLAKEQS